MPLRKQRLFISFDFDNDRILRGFVVGQAKNPDSPFEIEDWSMKKSAPQKNWEVEAFNRINRSDSVLVMVGASTYKARGVLKEVAMARTLKKQIFQVLGYKDGNYTAVPGAGLIYKWNWEDLKKLFPLVPI